MVFIDKLTKEQLWDERIESFLASGLKVREWCSEQGLPEHQLRYWLRKRNANVTSSEPIRWVSLESTQPRSSGVYVRIANTTVEVEPGFDHSVLIDVVQTLLTLC